jgi:hypothetical protein
MIESLCQAYHWPLEVAMKLTTPQTIMLNHASWVNYENADRKSKAKRDKDGVSNDEVRQERNNVESMSPENLSKYLAVPFN